MNGTPRLRSAYPSTPQIERQNVRRGGTQSAASSPSLERPSASNSDILKGSSSAPFIPLTILDAPTQRFYVFAFYLGLTAWRIYDYYRIVSEEGDSVPLFLKWVLVDAVFLFGLPELKIPWMEWSATTMMVLYVGHVIANGALMFRIPLPFEASLAALMKMLYDREVAVSERRVKPGSVLQPSSLIQGKQIVHILPEGSAMLNPEKLPLCIDSAHPSVELPIFINQTVPRFIELLRFDLDAAANEAILISNKEARRLKRQADKELLRTDAASPRVLRYPVRRAGLYRLTKIIDESNLEVQRRRSDTLVVNCPSARVEAKSKHKCRGELSDVQIHVDGTPPLKVRYSKSVNKEDKSDTFLSVHPANLDSPLVHDEGVSGTLLKLDNGGLNISWARTQHVTVPVNETLGIRGRWEYSIDEVHDAMGNIVRYSDNRKSKTSNVMKPQDTVDVHDTPSVLLDGCSPQMPLKIAKGNSAHLPLWINPSANRELASLLHEVTFSYAQRVGDDPTSGEIAQIQKVRLRPSDRGPEIKNPGFYSLNAISNQYCAGQVVEPSSCLLLNPPEPDLSISSEAIPHQCAGNSIGIRLNLDLIGTPPFYVSYISRREGGSTTTQVEKVDSLRSQLEFKPRESGRYHYEFLGISDAVYHDRPFSQGVLKFETDVKPTAWARFAKQDVDLDACIGEDIFLDVILSGDAPYSLEYDIVHGGKRRKFKETNISDGTFTITTPKLNKGGQHTLSLTSVTDASGCRIFLEQEIQIQVRHQRPGASFGLVEGQRSLLVLEGKKAHLPLRLSGEPPYTVSFSRSGNSGIMQQTLRNVNDELVVDAQDTYRLEKVSDRICPGSIDPSADKFDVRWVPRPALQIVEGSSIVPSDASQVKLAVCEGDQDSTDVSFTGNAPFHFEYDIHMKPDSGAPGLQTRREDVALHGTSIKMETGRAGWNEYRFSKLGDRSYGAKSSSFVPITLRQRINARPSARFLSTGKTYSFCREQTSHDDVVPVTLTGQPPFTLELSIRHHTSTTPEIVNIPNIQTYDYNFQIPRQALSLGSHSLSIRKVRDSNGCESTYEIRGPAVRINVVDVPSISPLEKRSDYCVGDRISFTLAGTPPFNVFYQFEGVEKRASSVATTFRRLAEKPGNFSILTVSDKASGDRCRAHSKITKVIHPLPSVRLSSGKVSEVDIHEGGEAEMLLEFEGEPPFEFTYTRSTTASKGRKSTVLETRSDISQAYQKVIKVSEEGTYEVVSLRDRYCSVATPGVRVNSGQQLLSF